MASNVASEGEVIIHQDGITPFWRKVPSFFLYPLHFGPMVCIGTLSLASVITAFTGGLFRGLLAYLFLRFAFGVMEQAATGDFNPDSPDVSMWGGKDHRPLKQTVVFLFYFGLLMGLATISAVPGPAAAQQAAASLQAPAAAAALPAAEEDDEDAAPAAASQRGSAYRGAEESLTLPWWFYALAIVFALPLPGAVMVIAIEDNLLRALNPLTTLFFIQGMGKAYFILWVFFAAILGAREGLLQLIPADASAFVRLPAEMLLGSYLMLALFAMMGYSLYQYHQELGYGVKVDFDKHRRQEAVASSKPVDPLTRSVNDLVAQGKVDDALRVVQDAMRYDKLNPDLNEKAFNLHQLKGDGAGALALGANWLKGLIAAKRAAKALPVLKKLRELDANFAPEADSILPLAQEALAAKNLALAVGLVKGFDKRFPGHADIPGVYFLGARISSEHLSQDEKAIAILKVLLQRYPEAGVAEEAKKYLTVLTNLAATAAAAPAK